MDRGHDLSALSILTFGLRRSKQKRGNVRRSIGHPRLRTFDDGRYVGPDREVFTERSIQKRRNELINDCRRRDRRCIAMKGKHEFPAVFGRPTTFSEPNDAIRPDRETKIVVEVLCINVQTFRIIFRRFARDIPVRSVIRDCLAPGTKFRCQFGQ